MFKKGEGAKGFSRDYWQKNYSKPREMDGIGNAREHANYMKATFKLDFIDISSVIDFGFGTGDLFKQVMKTFLPYKAHGIEPSRHIFNLAKEGKLRPVESTKLRLENIDLYSWALKQKEQSPFFDLGLCTSVFQYLEEDEIDHCLPIMAQKVKYLYFSVPTDKELDRQVSDLDFKDVYALRRSRRFYQKKLKPHFTFISSRILESKVHFDESKTDFTDLLYRF